MPPQPSVPPSVSDASPPPANPAAGSHPGGPSAAATRSYSSDSSHNPSPHKVARGPAAAASSSSSSTSHNPSPHRAARGPDPDAPSSDDSLQDDGSTPSLLSSPLVDYADAADDAADDIFLISCFPQLHDPAVVAKVAQSQTGYYSGLQPDCAGRYLGSSVDADNYDEVELYLCAEIARWHSICPRDPTDDEYLVFTVTKKRVTGVIKREFDNLTKEELLTHVKEVA